MNDIQECGYAHHTKSMNTKLISLSLLFLIISCNTEKDVDDVTSEPDLDSENNSQSSVVYDPSDAIWGYEYNEETEVFELKQLRSIDSNILSGESLEKIINTSWPRIELNFIKISNDTVYVSIPDSRVMTQQMGSAGAESFMVSTTFTFTELNGIHHVSFDFEEGDHAVPGVYDRNSWDRNVD